MKLDLIQQVIGESLAPRLNLRDIEQRLRKLLPDSDQAERAVGALYGHAFRRGEEAYMARGSRGRQLW
jgi:hypothetical protein